MPTLRLSDTIPSILRAVNAPAHIRVTEHPPQVTSTDASFEDEAISLPNQFDLHSYYAWQRNIASDDTTAFTVAGVRATIETLETLARSMEGRPEWQPMNYYRIGETIYDRYRVELSASSAREPASDPVEIRVVEESSDRKVRL